MAEAFILLEYLGTLADFQLWDEMMRSYHEGSFPLDDTVDNFHPECLEI